MKGKSRLRQVPEDHCNKKYGCRYQHHEDSPHPHSRAEKHTHGGAEEHVHGGEEKHAHCCEESCCTCCAHEHAGEQHGAGCSCGAVATYIQGGQEKTKQGVFTPHNILTALGLALFIVAAATQQVIGNRWISLAMYLVPYFLIGYRVLYHCLRNILHGRIFDENFLMTLATVGAFALGEYFEAVAVMIFYEIGERFQDFAVKKSVSRVKGMLDILPDTATRLVDGQPQTVKPSELELGDVVLVKAGERVPVDCVIVEGSASFDTSSLTGESIPKEYGEGEEILSGYINTQNLIQARVTKRLEQSTATRILDMVQSATEKKAKSEQFITRFARIYTPIVTLAAVFIAVALPLITRDISYIKSALFFLIVSCPCALVISIPLSYFAAIGACAKAGALFKGSNYLATLNDVDTIIFDKTGTLTQGSFVVHEIVSAGSLSEEQVLEAVACGESQSNHPIAKSVMQRYGKEVSPGRISEYAEIAGGGIRLKLDGKDLLLGKAGFLSENGVEFAPAPTPYTAVYLAVEGKYQGYLTLADQVRPDSAETLAELKKLGVSREIMLTGDSRRVAEHVGEELGLSKVYSETLPQQKLDIVEQIVQSNRKGRTAYVGDGINDVLALSRADIGISTGSTADAAIESADVVVPLPSIRPIAKAKHIARRTHHIVVQNIVFSLAVKVAVMVLGLMNLVPLLVAVLADVGCALITVLNAIRLMSSRHRVRSEK